VLANAKSTTREYRATRAKQAATPIPNLNADLNDDILAIDDLEVQQVLLNDQQPGRKEDHLQHVLREQRQKVKEVYS
jgi:hypothetical protein